jgi:hypothetical protein
LSTIVLFLICVGNSYSQGFKVPPAVESEYLNESVGTWISDEYEMMGMSWTDETTFNWVLNNQFLEMRSISNSSTDKKFETIGYISVDKEGNMKGWFFDIMGMDGVGVFKGKVDGMTATMQGGNEYMKSTGTVHLEDGVMTHAFKFTFSDPDGNEQTMEMTTISRKQ